MQQDPKLDAAIKKLMDSGASDDDITFFIQNYKPEKETTNQPPIETKAAEQPKTGISKLLQTASTFRPNPIGALAKIANSFIEPRINQVIGKEPGILNPDIEQNPLIAKSFLPETEASPGFFGAARHYLYDSLVRPMASPAGIVGALFDANPTPETTPTMLRSIGEEFVTKKPKVRAIGNTLLDPTTGEVIETGASKASKAIEPEVLPTMKDVTKAWGENEVSKDHLVVLRQHALSQASDSEILDAVKNMNRDTLMRKSYGTPALPDKVRDYKILQMEIKRRGLQTDLVPEPFNDPNVRPSPMQLTGEEKNLLEQLNSKAMPATEEKPLAAPADFKPPMFKGGGRKPPNPFALAKQKAASEAFGKTEAEIRSLVGETAATKTPPSQAPRYKFGKGGVVFDATTGERIGSVVRDKSRHPVDARMSPLNELANLPRAIQSSYDLSFPFRQGLGLIHTKGWWTSWDDMVKSFGSESAYDDVMQSIKQKPNYIRQKLPNGKEMKSFAEEAGLDIMDLISKREEAILSSWAEKIPGIRASNRAYTAFANKLRSDVFDSLIDQAEKAGLNPRKDMYLSKKIAEYVNNASGRGSLGSLEKSSSELAGLFFSPKLIASRVRMGNELLNPMTYKMASPFVKKQYWKSMIAMATAWTTMATAAKMAGANVNLDPDNSDFMKIKIGNTRLDPGGGFQQFIVLAHRLGSGRYTSSSSGKTTEFGSSYGAKARMDAIVDFLKNKLAPVPSTAAGVLSATKSRPFEVGDRTLRLFAPMIAQDLSELWQEDPTLIPAIIPAAVGMSSQTYDERGKSHRFIPESIWPKENDIRFKGGSFFPE